MPEVTKTYVEILYPGSFFSEEEIREISPKRDLSAVLASLPKTAFAFCIYDQTSKETVVDGEKQRVFGKKKNASGRYYPEAALFTADDLKNLKDGGDYRILISNMEGNNWKYVVRTRRGNFQPFEKGDQVI